MTVHVRSTLTAYYDLSVAPTSFDFATFLTLAEHRRRQQGHDHLHIIIVPAGDTRFWDREPYAVGYKEWRLNHLLLPLAELLPSDSTVTIAVNRPHAATLSPNADAIFPDDYSIDRPVEDSFQWAHIIAERACGANLPVWRVPDEARSRMQAWLAEHAGGRRVVSITLRNASYYPENNADPEAWAKFARSLDPARWLPVVLCDTEQAGGSMPASLQGLTVFSDAALDVRLRAALYEQAWINLSVATGPMMLMWLNPACRWLVFKLLNLENFRSTPTPLRGMGIEPGQQIIGSTSFQRLVWSADQADVIRAEFESMVARIEAAPHARDCIVEDPYITARRLRDTARLEPAARIYRHILATRGDAAAAFSLSMIELQKPNRHRLRRAARAAICFAEGLTRLAIRSWQTAEEGAEIGVAFHRWGLTQPAERVWRDVTAVNPHHPLANHGLGLIALQYGNASEAAICLRKSMDALPYSSQVIADLARALAASGDIVGAREAWSRAVTYDPSRSAMSAYGISLVQEQ